MKMNGEELHTEDLSNKFVEERRGILLSVIRKEERVSITELAKNYNLSEAMIRRDLIALEKKGLIKRTHGGAIIVHNNLEEITLKLRQSSQTDEKKRIAQAAAEFISDGEALFVDGGSTTLEFAKALNNKNNLLIVTNSLSFASEIAGVNNTKVILTGGELLPETLVMVGPTALNTLDQFRPDHVILGMSSMLVGDGFFTVNPNEAQVKKKMLDSCKSSIIVMDSTKLGKCLFSYVCDPSKIERIIIDNGVTEDAVNYLESKGVKVTIV